MEIDDNAAVVVGFEEQAAVPRIKIAVNPKVIHLLTWLIWTWTSLE